MPLWRLCGAVIKGYIGARQLLPQCVAVLTTVMPAGPNLPIAP